MSTPRNHIEFRTVDTDAPGHIAQTVLIDGLEVLVEEGGVKLDFGSDEFTTVTLTIIPKRVTFS